MSNLLSETVLDRGLVAEAKPPIRVLYIIDSLANSGGAELSLLRLTRSLPKDQFECRLLTFHVPENFRTPTGCPWEHWQLNSIFGWQAFQVARQLRQFVREQHFDIVHTFFQTSDLWAGPIAKASGAKILISSRRDMGILRKWKHSIGYRLMRSVFDQVQTVSESVRRYTVDEDGLDPDRSVTIYNGIDPTLETSGAETESLRREIGLPHGALVITTVASFRRVKGIDLLIHAVALLQQEMPGVRVLLAGHFGHDAQDHAYKEEVMRLNRKLGTDATIHILGETRQVLALLSISDVFVLPSRSEGLSNALLEAMGAGLPCVVTDTGGNSEVVVDGETGFVVPQEDPASLAGRILELLRDPALRRRMGAASRDRVHKRFTLQGMTSQVAATYRHLLARRESEIGNPTIRRSAPIRRGVSRGIQIVASRFGINTLLRALLLRKQFLVLCYHGVLSKSPLYGSSYGINVEVDQFEAQMKYLSKNFHMMSAEELLAVQEGREPLHAQSALITFDDGYMNNLTNVAPILRAHGIPAIFLISTGYIGGRQLLWPDEVFLRVLSWPDDVLPLPGGGVRGLSRDPDDREWAAEGVRESCKLLKYGQLMAYLKLLREGGPLPPDAHESEEYRFLNWGQVRELSRQGFEIGSHTVTHPILSRGTPDQLRSELQESKMRIEREINRECRMTAYPNGLTTDTGQAVWDAAAEAGYRTGFMLNRGLASAAKPMVINRVNVPGDEPPVMFESRAAGVYLFR